MGLDTDILVVGAGPIGLINAWGLKRLNPNLKICILEKYPKYQRNHTLIMQFKHLEAIMKATQSEQDPILVNLLRQLKSDPHIRTNKLQEIFTTLAQESGIEIKTQHEVTKDYLQQKLPKEFPNLRIIIGADGTHSIVSQTLFPENNQIKHEFDYVLQLRYEITGIEKSPGVRLQQFYQQMARKGLIANEYVGHFEEGKTPVTMQMMISKEDFLKLQSATSKNPLKPFAKNADKTQHLPPELSSLNSFITKYLEYKIADTRSAGQEIDQESIRISVNEAPATHAKQIVNKVGTARVVLEGDSALGLSYFKGLNAGLEATAQFLNNMSPSIKGAFKDTLSMDKLLHDYETWFLNDFSPKKVKEVGNYSFWQIRSFMKTMEIVRSIKLSSFDDSDEFLEPTIVDYFNHYSRDPLTTHIDTQWRPYPHREYELVQFGQFDYTPIKHTGKKIGKIFIDYFKPYKSNHQMVQDFKQPLVGIGNFFVGFAKVFSPIINRNPWYIADGLFNMLRGTIELVTTPLSWLIKPITRGFATLIHKGYKKIEESEGLYKLAQYGQDYLNHIPDQKLNDNKTIYELLAVCNDIHRKFEKSLSRGQSTDISLNEYSGYAAIRENNQLDRTKLTHYFRLFSLHKKEKVVQDNSLSPTNSKMKVC